MKSLFLLTVFFTISSLQGQKLVKKAFIDARTESIQIDSKYCYKVNLGTASTSEVRVVASIEGEYSKDLLINIENQGTTALISAGFQPNFTNPNDKLSAHKVISIELDITLPEYKDVSIYGTNSTVLAEGKYKSLKIKLSDGTCRLKNITETVEVDTQKGDIFLAANNGEIMAKSIYGTVDNGTIPLGENQYILNTVEGNIYLKKTK
ncbi:hypothetical protein HME9304_01267 [Flagellimonas maritima]|uniref:Adhesin domain-containing protein n=1 Tax=Flagellimonas maritima TaxID=1383885 RepID=A0A2Z4LSM9_9FLAO|nr:hypothetical protein [Allomuricauda aurantiaca]AWX44267.1 hypothetical protein HME9304_01267 [Allomuricauda aurantiaca]